jgi:hypothetical protein
MKTLIIQIKKYSWKLQQKLDQAGKEYLNRSFVIWIILSRQKYLQNKKQ